MGENRWEQTSQAAQDLLADYDELDLAEMLVAAQAAIARARAECEEIGTEITARILAVLDTPKEGQ